MPEGRLRRVLAVEGSSAAYAGAGGFLIVVWKQTLVAAGYKGDARARSWLLGVLLLALQPVWGCSPAYVLRLGLEEGKILWRRQPITALLAREDLPDGQRRKLTAVLEAREFAQEKLGLNAGGSFTTVSYLTPGTEVYVLSAAPVDSLEPYRWWFPIVGRVPYKGFFDRGRAEAARKTLEARGFDTYLRTAAAFSTLGWFDDPILLSSLKQDEVSLVNMVLHELCHNTFSLGGDTSFDESFANFVGTVGVVDFFVERYGQESALARRAKDAREDELVVADFFGRLREELTVLYSSGLPRAKLLEARQGIFRRALARSRHLKLHRPIDLSAEGLNNAIVIHHLLYLTGIETFMRWYREHGEDLRETINAIALVVNGSDSPFAALQATR